MKKTRTDSASRRMICRLRRKESRLVETAFVLVSIASSLSISSGFHLDRFQRRAGLRYSVGFCRSKFTSYATPTSEGDANGLVSAEETTAVNSAVSTQFQRSLGLLTLLSVPLVWGTYVPTVRFIYDVDPPVPGFVFSASYLCVAAISSTAARTIRRQTVRHGGTTAKRDDSSFVATKAGIELGLYTFLASSLQVIGLESVPSDRAGFLIQLTTIMVPIVQAVLDRNFLSVPPSTWLACIVALLGVAVMGIDINGVTSANPLHLAFSRGDLFIVGAAFLYTLHVVRLGYWARQTNPLNLANAKSIVQCILSLGLVAFLGSATLGENAVIMINGSTRIGSLIISRGQEIINFFMAFTSKIQSGQFPLMALGKIVGAITWSGVVGTAYVLYAQSYGQSFVRPSDANLIYSLQPIFTAIFAYLLLGETMDASGFIGGALILGAVLLAASQAIVAGDASKQSR